MAHLRRAVSIGVCASALLCLLATSAIGQQQTPPTSRRAVADPSRFDSILNVQWVCRKTLSQCGRQVLKEVSPGGHGVFDDLGREGVREETFALSNGVAIFLLTIMDNEDDSVAGERFRVEFKRVKGGYRLTRIGRQFRCLRGGSRDWIKELCP